MYECMHECNFMDVQASAYAIIYRVGQKTGPQTP